MYNISLIRILRLREGYQFVFVVVKTSKYKFSDDSDSDAEEDESKKKKKASKASDDDDSFTIDSPSPAKSSPAKKTTAARKPAAKSTTAKKTATVVDSDSEGINYMLFVSQVELNGVLSLLAVFCLKYYPAYIKLQKRSCLYCASNITFHLLSHEWFCWHHYR